MDPHDLVHSRFGTLLAISFVLCGGCNPLDSGGYSGVFSVVNHSGQDVGVIRWEGFGFASPGDGNLIAECTADAFFPPLEAVPDFTIVTWGPLEPGQTFFEIDAAKLQKQRIDLRGVIPRGVAGTTRFVLTMEGQWEVSFDPEKRRQ